MISDALVLGSASPRRAELLARLGVQFSVRAADIDETPTAGEAPRDYVQRMAREKAQALHCDAAVGLLLTADTSVILENEILGKPGDADDARRMLHALSGTTHEVCTALCVGEARRYQRACVTTLVEFVPLTDRLIEAYLCSDEPWDKAGSYALQGLAASFVRGVRGSVTNVIGLPLAETRELLLRCGVEAGIGAVVLRPDGAEARP